MEIVTTELLSELISEASEKGESRSVEIDDSQIGYLRMLVSTYNSKRGKKFRARRISGVNWAISAPFDRFIDQERWKGSFGIIQRVLNNPDAKITAEEYAGIERDLATILSACKNQLDEPKGSHDLLK